MFFLLYRVDSGTIRFDGPDLPCERCGVSHGPDLPCERCGVSTPGIFELYYRYRGVFLVFSVVTARYYYRHCDLCGSVTDLSPREARAILGGNPIPLHHRFGIIGLVVVSVLLLLLSGL